MSKHMIRVEMTMPRSLLDEWPSPPQLEAGLRAHGLWPATAEQVRWRVEHASAGYIVECVVSLRIDKALHP